MNRFKALLAASLVATAASGCGGASSALLSEEATVKGKVVLDRKPLTEGKILFTPDAAGSPREAVIAKDGTYVATTLTGFNTIKIDGAPVAKNPKLGNYVFSFDVQAGENSFDLVMDSKGPW